LGEGGSESDANFLVSQFDFFTVSPSLLIAEVEYESRNVLVDPELRTAVKDYR